MTATARSTTEASGERRPDGAPGVDLPEEVLAALGAGEHSGPHAFLGQHPVDGAPDGTVVIRALRPFARAVVAVLDGGARVELGHAGHGVWQGLGTAGAGAYAVEATYEGGEQWTADDQYRFLPSIGDVDLHLFGEGRHERLWEMLGARVRVMEGQGEPVTGTSFAVWAPHASAVQVIADFNGWDGRLHAMRRMDANGVWELFVPGVGTGTTYKFRIRTAAGDWIEKADPFARLAEVPPRTASVVTESGYEWADAGWLEERTATEGQHAPMSIYEVHLGSWRPGLGYRELAEPLIEHVTSLGFTHVEFLPLAEHPFGGSWGYQVSGYYAPTSRFGSPDDLKFLIDRLHEAGIGVIVDWVPAHFPKDAFALALFDGQPLYEHSDPRLGEQQDWGTLVFNFGDSQVRNFLVANALYWLEEFHVDGLRVDAVASMLYLDYSRTEWLPNKYGGRENLEAIAFLQEANATAYKLYPGIVMIAEESTSWGGVTRPTEVGGLGFGRKWNMGWMNDGLRYIAKDPMWRGEQHSQVTFSFHYAFSENFLLPISHDEVVHGKGSLYGRMPGDEWQKRANVRVFLAHMWAHPGKQLLFMGQEFGQQTEWSEERGVDWHQLDWHGHRELMALTGRLNALYRSTPALYELDDEPGGFAWIDGGDTANSVLAYERRDRDGSPVVVLVNFSGAPVGPYRVGIPFAGEWREALNTDDAEFGGSGVGNGDVVTATEEGHHGRPASVELTLPPLGALWLVPVTGSASAEAETLPTE